jgi:hypothetical protein
LRFEGHETSNSTIYNLLARCRVPRAEVEWIKGGKL